LESDFGLGGEAEIIPEAGVEAGLVDRSRGHMKKQITRPQTGITDCLGSGTLFS